MRLAALATGLLLLALAGHFDREIIEDALLSGPSPFEALFRARVDPSGVTLTSERAIESRTPGAPGAKTAALEGSTDQQISQ